ncbi:MAG: hypothetical protein LBV63_05120 [Candidatus Methanoplasma sp.]|jgi:hypothetical protein|nr:hypothetical protein [Candidatus Methanoplasma sp.]
MTQRVRMMWAAVTVITVAAAALSLIAAVSAGENTALTVISVAAAAMFLGCTYISWSAGSKYQELSEVDDNIECFRLKRPGIGTAEMQEITPKGKMPQGKVPEGRLRHNDRSERPVPAKGKMPKE